MRPRISIIICVRNARNQLSGALENIRRQLCSDLELILVDGDSSDGTKEFIEEHKTIIRQWISEPDNGVYDAMHKGISMALGEWMLFLGADDRLRDGVIQRVLPQLLDPAVIYYGDVWMPGRATRWAGRFSTLKLARTNICQQAIFYPRIVFQKYRFDLRYPIQADWELNMRCWADPGLRFQYLPEVISDFNDVGGLSSTHADSTFNKDYNVLLKRHFPFRIYAPWMFILFAGRFVKTALFSMNRSG